MKGEDKVTEGSKEGGSRELSTSLECEGDLRAGCEGRGRERVLDFRQALSYVGSQEGESAYMEGWVGYPYHFVLIPPRGEHG
eukprot:753164-Hanusia_phi.AAC.1